MANKKANPTYKNVTKSAEKMTGKIPDFQKSFNKMTKF